MALGSMVGAQWYDLSGGRGTNGGWDVELLFATRIDQSSDPNGSAAVGTRASMAHGTGLRVLVRVDFAPGQSMPPTGDEAARSAFVLFLQALCQQADYQAHVFGYIIGNECNLPSENQLMPQGSTLSPEWYARVFSGYHADPSDTGNAYSSIKTFQPNAWVLVGPVAPWSDGANGLALPRWDVDQPWLNYFFDTARHIREAAVDLGRHPDGFAIHAYGRTSQPGSPTFSSNEPHLNVPFGSTGAQGGFRVYRDWCAIIDRAGFDPALPVFVTETNTFTGLHSCDSYPTHWYLEALRDAGPRFHALCWFVDHDPSGGWEDERLTDPKRRCAIANADLNRRSPRDSSIERREVWNAREYTVATRRHETRPRAAT